MPPIRRPALLFRCAPALALLAVLAACGDSAGPVSSELSPAVRSAADSTGTVPGDSATWERRIILY